MNATTDETRAELEQEISELNRRISVIADQRLNLTIEQGHLRHRLARAQRHLEALERTENTTHPGCGCC